MTSPSSSRSGSTAERRRPAGGGWNATSRRSEAFGQSVSPSVVGADGADGADAALGADDALVRKRHQMSVTRAIGT